MTDIEIFYNDTDSDYAGTLQRLGSAETVERFAKKFAQDQSYFELCASLEAGDVQTAFRAAHTLKGVCATLGFTSLYETAFAETEALRAEDIEEGRRIFPVLSSGYAEIINKLKNV